MRLLFRSNWTRGSVAREHVPPRHLGLVFSEFVAAGGRSLPSWHRDAWEPFEFDPLHNEVDQVVGVRPWITEKFYDAHTIPTPAQGRSEKGDQPG